MIRKILIFFLTLFAFTGYSQQESNINLYEDSLSQMFDSLFAYDGTKYYKTDSQKAEINNKILTSFNNALKEKESLDYNFSKIKNCGLIKSEDNSLRLITWNIKFKNGSYKYYGFIQHVNNAKKRIDIFPLIDISDKIQNPEKASLNNLQWYGALYYKIIITQYSGKKYYTLLAWDGNNYLTTKKIIDVLVFTKSGKPKFGKPIFKTDKTRTKRVFFEFSSKAVMSLQYDKRYKAIVFDHLAPSKSIYKDNYQFYGPDFTFDAYFFENGKWVFKNEIEVKNPKKKRNKSK